MIKKILEVKSDRFGKYSKGEKKVEPKAEPKKKPAKAKKK